MPFVTVEKSSRGIAYGVVAEIRMGSHLQSTKRTSRGIYFAMTRSVIDQAGWTLTGGMINKDREVYPIVLREGVGEDAGFMLLAQSDEGNSYALGLSTRSSKSFNMSVSVVNLKHYVMNDVPVPSAPVEFTVDEKDHTVLIQVPDWLRYNPLSYQAPLVPVKEVVRQMPNPTQAVRKGGKINATVSNVALLIGEQLPEANRTERRDIARSLTRSLRS